MSSKPKQRRRKPEAPRLPDAEREQLEQERDFLLRSLDDLELEHESGGIDDESYAELHDDYTARAAAAIRALRDGVDNRPEPAPPVPAKRRVAIIAGGGGVRDRGRRRAGRGARRAAARARPRRATRRTRAAKVTAKELKARITELEAKANASPNDYQTRLDLARAYEQNNDNRSTR